LQTIDRARIDDNELRITVNNDQCRSTGTSVREYSTGIAQQLSTSHRSIQEPSLNVQFSSDQSYKSILKRSTQDRSAQLSHFQEALPTSQYGKTYKEPVPPVKEIVQQTGSLLSHIDNWNTISLQPKHDLATATSQSSASQPLLVNISNSKYANLDASSSLAQNLLKNINLLGKAFSSSTVTYRPSESITATSASLFPSTSTSLFASSTGYGDSMLGSVVSSKLEGTSSEEQLSLKYRQPQTSSSDDQPLSTTTSSTCDPVIANVLKSIGFNFDLSKFGSTVVPKEREQSHASTLLHSSVSSTPPQPVPPPQVNDLLQTSQNLATPLKAQSLATPLKPSTMSAYNRIAEMKTFSEIDKVLQQVRKHSESKLRSRSPVKERFQSRSGRRSSSVSREDDRSTGKQSPRPATTQKHMSERNERWEHAAQGSERHSGHVLKRDEVRRQDSPSPRQQQDLPLPRQRRDSPSPRQQRDSPLPLPRQRRDSPSPRRQRDSPLPLPRQRRDSPSPRQRDTRTGKASKRKSYSSRSSSASPHRRKSNVQRHRSPLAAVPVSCQASTSPHYSQPPIISSIPGGKWVNPALVQKIHTNADFIKSTPLAAVPMSYPASSYPLHSQPFLLSSVPGGKWENPVLVQETKKDADWEKSTDEFLRKLQEPSRPSAVTAAHVAIPEVESDLSNLSSISSGSVSDYFDDSVCEEYNKPFSSPLKPSCHDTVDRSKARTSELKDSSPLKPRWRRRHSTVEARIAQLEEELENIKKHGDSDRSKSRDRVVNALKSLRASADRRRRVSNIKSSSKMKKVCVLLKSYSSSDC